MFHIIRVGMNGDLLQRLDALRDAFPDSANRGEIINALIAEAHERLAQSAPARS